MPNQNPQPPPFDLSGYETACAAQTQCEQALARASDAVSAAEAATAAAQASFDAAIAAAASGQPDAQPMTAQQALQQAKADLAMAQQILDATTTALATATAVGVAAWNARSLPSYLYAIQQRIAAAARADSGRAELVGAAADTVAANVIIEAAFASGLPRPFDGGRLNLPVRTEAAERAIWAGVAT